MQKIKLNDLTRQQVVKLWLALANTINASDIKGLQVKPTQEQVDRAKRLFSKVNNFLNANNRKEAI